MSKKLRIIAIALTLIMVIGMMPLSIFAADEAETPNYEPQDIQNPYYDRMSLEEAVVAGATALYDKETVINRKDGSSPSNFYKVYKTKDPADSSKTIYIAEQTLTEAATWTTRVQNEDGGYTLYKQNYDEKFGFFYPIASTNLPQITGPIEIDGKTYNLLEKAPALTGEINYYAPNYSFGAQTEQINFSFRVMGGAAMGSGQNEIIRIRYLWKNEAGTETDARYKGLVYASRKADGLHLYSDWDMKNDLGFVLREDVYTDFTLSLYIEKANAEDKTGTAYVDIYANGIKVAEKIKLQGGVSAHRITMSGTYMGVESYASPNNAAITYGTQYVYSGKMVNENTNPFSGIVEVENGFYVYENSLPTAFINPNDYVSIENASVTLGDTLGISLNVKLPTSTEVHKAVVSYDDGVVAPPAEEGGAEAAAIQTKDYFFKDMTQNEDGTYTIEFTMPAGADITDGISVEFYNVTPGAEGAEDVLKKVSALEGTKIFETYNTNVFAALKSAIEIGDAELESAIKVLTEDLKAQTDALNKALEDKVSVEQLSQIQVGLTNTITKNFQAADDIIKDDLATANKAIADLVKALDDAKKALNDSIDAVKKDLKDATDALNASIATKADAATVTNDLKNLTAAYKAADLVLEDADKALAEADAAMAAAITALRGDVDAHAERLDSIETMNTIQLVLIIVVGLVAIAALVLPFVMGKKKEND